MSAATVALRQKVESVGGVGELTVSMVSYGKDAELETVLAGTAAYESFTATQDGRQANTQEWHEGASTDDEWVYYERFNQAGRVAHGWIDRSSRKLLQTG